jgi:hypothetical protein
MAPTGISSPSYRITDQVFAAFRRLFWWFVK